MNIQSITNTINKLIQSARLPIKTIPTVMLLCSVIKRPGMSAMLAAANAIKGQSKFGAPTGDLPDGTPNMMNAMMYTLTEAIYRDIKMNGVVQIGIPIGGIEVTVMGENAGGPVVCKGTNTNNATGYGTLR
jgi:hypothetical protein